MALRMPRPYEHKSGTYYLNVRLPKDVADKAKGGKVTLPIGDAQVATTLTDKAFVSLRTREAAVAKLRFTVAYETLTRRLSAIKAGPQPLPYKQIVALAGEVYRERVERDQRNPNLGPEHLERELAEATKLCRELKGIDLCGDLGEVDLNPLASVIVAHAEGGGSGIPLDAEVVCEPDFPWRKLAGLYGSDVDEVLGRHGVIVDGMTRARLLQEIAKAAEDAARCAVRNMLGDFSPDPIATRFPPFQPDVQREPRRETGDRISFDALAERWKEANRKAKAASTIRRYEPSLSSFARFIGRSDFRTLTDDQVYAWAKHRRDIDGIHPKTVNRNDLVAVSSVLAWATTHQGGKLGKNNPAAGVKLEKPKSQQSRPPTFYAREVAAILLAARAARPNRRYPRASASRRWIPWICAYSGARVQEVCWLGREDVWCEAGTWIIKFAETKDDHARLVPVHAELEREGFLNFLRSAPDGYLFVGDQPQRANATRTQQEQRASEIAEWVREQADLPKDVSPNHGWRHTFCTIAEAAGIPKRFSNALSGHNKRKDASDGYITPSVEQLHAEMKKFPVFELKLIDNTRKD